MLLSRAWPQRAAAHLAAWAPFVYGLVKSLASGWAATSDNGVIALRSWDVLTTHGPLVGQATRLGIGVFDLGPLEYWLLTVPVHLDGAHGVLWGATLWCMAAASLIVEAAWAVGGVFAALAASAVVLGVTSWIPDLTVEPCWNPWLGLMFFIAALAAGWAVMSGRRGWWAAAVVSASIAAQAHLMFAIAVVPVAVVVFAIGLADTVRAKASYWWAIAGVIAAIACWAAPLVQQFTGNPGNMTALFSQHGPPAPKAGAGFGLKAISAATQPPAYWWHGMNSLGKLSYVWERSAVGGATAFTIIAVSLGAAVWLRSRRAAGLAVLSLILAGAALITYASVPVAEISKTTVTFDNLRYLLAPLYPLGVLTWLTVVTVAVLAARRVMGRAPTPAAADGTTAGGTTTSAAGPRLAYRGMPISAFAAGALVVAAALAGPIGNTEAIATPVMLEVMHEVNGVAGRIEHKIPPQRVALKVVAPDNRIRRQLTFGVAYALRADGYLPKIAQGWSIQLGDSYWYPGQRKERIPLAEVWVKPSTLAVKVMRHPPPGTWAGLASFQPLTWPESGEYFSAKPHDAWSSQLPNYGAIAMEHAVQWPADNAAGRRTRGVSWRVFSCSCCAAACLRFRESPLP